MWLKRTNTAKSDCPPRGNRFWFPLKFIKSSYKRMLKTLTFFVSSASANYCVFCDVCVFVCLCHVFIIYEGPKRDLKAIHLKSQLCLLWLRWETKVFPRVNEHERRAPAGVAARKDRCISCERTRCLCANLQPHMGLQMDLFGDK